MGVTVAANWRSSAFGSCRKSSPSSRAAARKVELVSRLHEELDDKAVAALKQWEFEPGQREGKPVAVRITVDMHFVLR